jgi:hypothetical protein
LSRKDAKAQRNKGLTQEDVKPGLRKTPFASLRLCEKKNFLLHRRTSSKGAKKKLFAAWRLCANKNKYLEEEKFTFPFVTCLPQVGFARTLKSISDTLEVA